MADKTIGSLPRAASLTDNSSFVCEDNGEAKRVTGKQFKDFAKEGASPAVKAAESAADRAEAAVAKTPKIQNGTWWTFDAVTQSYVDTGVEAQGQPGVPGEKGDPGEPGHPGEKGDPFRYEDFTPEQLDDLERGAKAAQVAAETAAASAATSAEQASVSEQNAAGSASAAAQSASSIGEAERIVTEKASEASSSAANAAASAEAAEKSAEKAANIAGGNFATKTEAQGYADTAESNAKSYTDQQISSIPTPDVSGQIGEHNTNAESHNDIRELIIGLTNRLNTLADSDDTTLDQFSEVVAYIKNNKSLIDGITTSKVNVADIINNLTTNVSNKPLSAAQGVVLKALIDAITVPTKVSELENDSGYLTHYTETDPTVPSWAKAKSKPTYTASEVGAVPTNRTVNGKALSSNITLNASDVDAYSKSETDSLLSGKAASSHTHGAGDITSGTFASSRLPTVPVSKGGTGKTSLTSGSYLVGNGTSAVAFKTPAQVASAIGAEFTSGLTEYALDRASAANAGNLYYSKMENGVTVIRGVLGGSFTNGTVIGTLPAGYRPVLAFTGIAVGASASLGTTVCTYEIRPDGSITVKNLLNTYDFITLSAGIFKSN